MDKVTKNLPPPKSRIKGEGCVKAALKPVSWFERVEKGAGVFVWGRLHDTLGEGIIDRTRHEKVEHKQRPTQSTRNNRYGHQWGVEEED